MKILSGYSTKNLGSEAVKEAIRDWAGDKEKVKFLIVFHSTAQPSKEVADALTEQFPGVPNIGCSTAGEYINWKHQNNSLVINAVASDEIRWAVDVLPEISALNQDRVNDFAGKLAAKLDVSLEKLVPEKHFCLGFIDGLSMKEEGTAALMSNALGVIPCIGGSAGDDLKFKQTQVIANGKSYSNAAVYVLGESSIPFHVLKHQHFLRSDKDLIVTEMDAPKRKVISFDGEPAAVRYAELLGLRVEDLSVEVFSNHPITYSCNNEIYVRSIQKIEEDKSLTFYCAVEEGMVLEIADHQVMEEALQKDIEAFTNKIKEPQWFIGCNCILRSLEASSKEKHEAISKIVNNLAPYSIGFDTYGEQLDGLHINQTIVGIAFGQN